MRKLQWIALLSLVLALGVSAAAADVAVLNSGWAKNWYMNLGWDYDSEIANIRATLEGMGLSYVEITDEQLAAGELGDAKLLILMNNRMMSAAQVDAVKAFIARGGKVFGLYQSSFRNEANQNVNPVNSYLLDEVYKISWVQWSGSAPFHAYIKGDTSHPIWEGLPEFVPTPRYTAMVNATLEGGQVVGEWYNADQVTKTQPDVYNAAIVVTDATVYVGENLFDPAVYREQTVRQLIQNIINYLL